jgi:hypothetical protein
MFCITLCKPNITSNFTEIDHSLCPKRWRNGHYTKRQLHQHNNSHFGPYSNVKFNLILLGVRDVLGALKLAGRRLTQFLFSFPNNTVTGVVRGTSCVRSVVAYCNNSDFGGLEVACWSLVHKFAGSHPAEDVGFLGRKTPQHAFLWEGK